MKQWLKDYLKGSFRLYLMYMTGGFAAIPAGIAYGLLDLSGHGQWYYLVPVLVVGLILMELGYCWMGRKINPNGKWPHYEESERS